MSNTAQMVKLCGLWQRTSKNGNTYLSGWLGTSTVLIFENRDHNAADPKSPTHHVYIAGREGQGNQSQSHPKTSPRPSQSQERLPIASQPVAPPPSRPQWPKTERDWTADGKRKRTGTTDETPWMDDPGNDNDPFRKAATDASFELPKSVHQTAIDRHRGKKTLPSGTACLTSRMCRHDHHAGAGERPCTFVKVVKVAS